MFRVFMVVRMSAHVFRKAHMPHVSHVALHSRHSVKEHAEAALLSVVEGIIEGLRRISDLLHFSSTYC